jgi:hypothetical protein
MFPNCELPGDRDRRRSVVERWFELFGEANFTYWDVLHPEGFKFGPINWLNDAETMTDLSAEKWTQRGSDAVDTVQGEEKHSQVYVFAKSDVRSLCVWQAARASASAPTYFPPMRLKNFYSREYYFLHPENFGSPDQSLFSKEDNASKFEDGFFCDGGVVDNNPGLRALRYLAEREACCLAGSNDNRKNSSVKPEPFNVGKYALLSIGSGSLVVNVDVDQKLDFEPEKTTPFQSRDPLSDSQNRTEARMFKRFKKTFQTIKRLPKSLFKRFKKTSQTIKRAVRNLPKSLNPFDRPYNDAQSGSEFWWIAQKGDLVILLTDNAQMIAHANLRTLYALAGRKSFYLRIQYRVQNGGAPENIIHCVGGMDDPSAECMKAYKEIGGYLGSVYGGVIDQFVYLHVLTETERQEFNTAHPTDAEKARNASSIINDTEWKKIQASGL